MDKLWREIFKQKYDTCSTLILKETVSKIILRLEIIGKNPPPFFGNLLISILKHPNIDSIAKEVTYIIFRALLPPLNSTISTSTWIRGTLKSSPNWDLT